MGLFRITVVLLGCLSVLLVKDAAAGISHDNVPKHLLHQREQQLEMQLKMQEYFVRATCSLQSNTNVKGTVSFKQLKIGGPLAISVDVIGVDPESSHLHGFHVHEFGDVGDACKAAGGHYNPFGKNHGGPKDKERHVGDFGNVPLQSDGSISTVLFDGVASLIGEYSIIGKSIVLHQDDDDLGKGDFDDSLTTGHAGARIACCVITEN